MGSFIAKNRLDPITLSLSLWCNRMIIRIEANSLLPSCRTRGWISEDPGECEIKIESKSIESKRNGLNDHTNGSLLIGSVRPIGSRYRPKRRPQLVSVSGSWPLPGGGRLPSCCTRLLRPSRLKTLHVRIWNPSNVASSSWRRLQNRGRVTNPSWGVVTQSLGTRALQEPLGTNDFMKEFDHFQCRWGMLIHLSPIFGNSGFNKLAIQRTEW